LSFYTQFIYSNRDLNIVIALCSKLLHSAIAIIDIAIRVDEPDIGHILFLRILYHIPYHGPKKDIISYHISRPKKGYRIYILYPFQFENEPNMAWIGIKHRKVVISMFIFGNMQLLTNANAVQCVCAVQCVIQKRTPHNKCKQKLHCAKEKKRGKVQICTEKRI
jgi:hypothetical protein